MNEQVTVNHGDGMRRRSHRRLRTLFLSSGLMATVAAGPAFAKVDRGPGVQSQEVKKKKG